MQHALVHMPSGQVALTFDDCPKPGEYELVPVIAPDMPPGEHEAGRPEYLFNRAVGVVEKFVHIEDKVHPPSPAAKLDRLLNIAGLTIDEARVVLGISAEQGSQLA